MEDIKNYAAVNEVPIIKDEGLKMLLEVVKENNCRSILELGTAIGYSAINIAKISQDIKIDTIEKKEELYIQAVNNVKSEKLENQINLYNTRIEEFDTDIKYDLIFVDAAKAQYYKYINKFYDNLIDGGIIICDNLEFHGLVNDPSLTKNRNTKMLVRKIGKFKEEIKNDLRFNNKYYPHIGDGILILKKES